jgi:hypothetical protein
LRVWAVQLGNVGLGTCYLGVGSSSNYSRKLDRSPIRVLAITCHLAGLSSDFVNQWIIDPLEESTYGQVILTLGAGKDDDV